ncbi:cupin fold metalloprotein, WbuC family [Bacteroides pyogenes]|uniref:WbuC family cupin fold metalloprotein n=1 Tax=Bacteroides pyogenes TaxID=310300 RepID=UPI0011E3E6B6|nr:WbuC family cupin fold metalloprotein [Bacteroides pyogenes]TYK33763.1 cupin fold metalloprotein, WbuC family [Bacteroides pyogenes]
MNIDKDFLDSLLEQAAENPRLRINYDLRTNCEEPCQRMLNALQPGTSVTIHHHPNSTEDVLCLCGRMDEVLYDDKGNEIERFHLCPREGMYGCVVPKGAWHTVEVYEPSVMYEAKAGKYGEDGSEGYPQSVFCNVKEGQGDSLQFKNSLGDLKKNIEYLIGVERHSGSMEVISSLYVSRMLNVPLDEVEAAMKEMGI